MPIPVCHANGISRPLKPRLNLGRALCPPLFPSSLRPCRLPFHSCQKFQSSLSALRFPKISSHLPLFTPACHPHSSATKNWSACKKLIYGHRNRSHLLLNQHRRHQHRRHFHSYSKARLAVSQSRATQPCREPHHIILAHQCRDPLHPPFITPSISRPLGPRRHQLLLLRRIFSPCLHTWHTLQPKERHLRPPTTSPILILISMLPLEFRLVVTMCPGRTP